MPASVYTPGFGTALKRATITGGTVGTYTAIAQTRDVSSPAPEVGKIKVTNNDSPNNSHEYGPGLTDPGDAEFECVWNKAQHSTLMSSVGNGVTYSWQILFPDASTCTFLGFLGTGSVESKTEDEAMTGKIKVTLTGPPFWA